VLPTASLLLPAVLAQARPVLGILATAWGADIASTRGEADAAPISRPSSGWSSCDSHSRSQSQKMPPHASFVGAESSIMLASTRRASRLTRERIARLV
jgi:hypothetical protein